MHQLRDFPLFDELSESAVNDILGRIHSRSFQKKTQIVTEGEVSHSLYFLLEGKVKVYLDDETGKEIIVNIHKAGDFFGELGLIKSIPRTASVLTLDDCRMGVMQEVDFRRTIDKYPQFSLNLLRNLTDRLIEATETIRKLGLMDVYGRIAVTFLNMSEEVDGRRIIPEKLTQQSIANRVGASREMVARILKDLKNGEYISIEDNQIIIRKPLPQSW